MGALCGRAVRRGKGQCSSDADKCSAVIDEKGGGGMWSVSISKGLSKVKVNADPVLKKWLSQILPCNKFIDISRKDEEQKLQTSETLAGWEQANPNQ